MNNTIKISMGLIFTLLFLQSCITNRSEILNNIDFKTVRYQTKDGDTIGIYGKLASKQIIDGYPCAADWVKFSDNWKLKEFRLSEDFQIYNINFKKDTWVFYNDEFQLTSVLPQETKIQGYKCIGGGGKKGIHTSFYSNGKLKTFFTPYNIEVNNILCKGGKLNYISLYKDGKLKKCKLVNDQEIEGVIFKKNTVLEFNKSGNVKK